jgi:hypothetical protein
MKLAQTTRLGLLSIAVAVACGACSSNGSDATANHADSPPPAARSIASPAPGTGGSSTTPVANGDSDAFCALARKIGLANIAVTDGGASTDAASLLSGIDMLDAAAPTEIRSDFDTFDKLEHAVLDPTGQQPPDPGADVAAAMTHVSEYLSKECGLG